VAQWSKAKDRVHHALPKVREFIHRATWALGSPERKKLEELYKNYIRPKVPFPEIRTLATDSSSRTSVELSRIVLARKYGANPTLFAQPPHLGTMLEHSDAALIIGDAALVLNPPDLPFHVADLALEWTEMTSLPMVFAVWAARVGFPKQDPAPFAESLRFGIVHIDDIVREEHPKLGISADLARDYLTRNITFELGDREYSGLTTFLQYASELKTQPETRKVTA